MRLSQATDFALRVLMLLGSVDEPQTVESAAIRLALPKSHLMKIVAKLAHSGLVASTRGRGGGIRLQARPEEILIGEVVRIVEPDFALVSCLENRDTVCVFLPSCRLKQAMHEAAGAFVRDLNRHTLADILAATPRPPEWPAGIVAAEA